MIFPPASPWLTSPSSRGLVRANGKGLVDDGGPFLTLACSFFWLLWGLKFDYPRTIRNLDWLKQRGVTAVRVLGSVDSANGWADRHIDPGWSDYADILDLMFRELRTRGMRVIFCCFGDVTNATPTSMHRRAHVTRCVDAGLRSPGEVLYYTVSNEGIGFIPKRDDPEIEQLAQLIRQRSPFLVNGVSDRETLTDTLHAAHTPRKITGDGGMWEHTEQPYDLHATSLVASDQEPIGPESSVEEDDDALRNAAHALCCWVVGGSIYVCHPGAGIRGGGQADLDRGRFANFYDQPTLDDMLAKMVRARDFLPRKIAEWRNVNHSDPSREGRYPFATGPLQPFDPRHWFLKTYANDNGQEFAGLFTGVHRDVPLQANRPTEVTVNDLQGHVQTATLSPGQQVVVRANGVFAFRGRFL